jgi:hypothetical protein
MSGFVRIYRNILIKNFAFGAVRIEICVHLLELQEITFALKPVAAKKIILIYSWVSYDVINLTGVNSKSRHSHQSELIVHSCMCWPCVWWQIHAISHHLLNPVQHKHQYILG